MTLEQKYDLWERFARLVYEEAIRTSRASRKQMKKLNSMWTQLESMTPRKQPGKSEPKIRTRKKASLRLE